MRRATAVLAGVALALGACGGSIPRSYDRAGLEACLQQNGASTEPLNETTAQGPRRFAQSSFIAHVQGQNISFLFEPDADEAKAAMRILEKSKGASTEFAQRGNVIIERDTHTTKGALRITDTCRADATKT